MTAQPAVRPLLCGQGREEAGQCRGSGEWSGRALGSIVLSLYRGPGQGRAGLVPEPKEKFILLELLSGEQLQCEVLNLFQDWLYVPETGSPQLSSDSTTYSA